MIPAFFLYLLLISLLGIGTLVYGIWKTSGRLRRFLLLAGSSLLGFVVFGILHNAFYGLATITTDITLLSSSMEVLDVVFFCMAVFVCPAGFLVGAIGSMVLFIRKPKVAEPD